MPQRTRPHRIAIVGAGPSGLFSAQALDKLDPGASVDIYERLPTPFGLLRYGVAPDHTSIKSVAENLGAVLDLPQVRFRGLVEVGRDMTRADLLNSYDAVIYCVGASDDQRIGIPGEVTEGSRSARQFVDWYSGHPDAIPQSLDDVHSVVTIGVGNVALDVARLLLKTARSLHPTDMTYDVLGELHEAQITEVSIVGRRGPEHASFTPVELREILSIPHVNVVVEGVDPASIDTEGLERRSKNNVELLRDSLPPFDPEAIATLRLIFWHRPVRIEGEKAVESIVLEKTELNDEGRVVGTGEEMTIECQRVLRAIGYKGVGIPDVPLEPRRGIIPNEEGRVLGEDGQPLPGEYCAGWIKRGPNGVVGTNKGDAMKTVKALLADLEDAPERDLADPDALLAARGVHPVDAEAWKRIDRAEVELGSSQGRDRSKIDGWTDLVEIARTKPLVEDEGI